MIELRPPGTLTEIRSASRILLPNWWVKFSDKFPDYLSHVKGKSMRVARQQQVVFTRSYNLKENCYKDINLSNEDTGEKLFPDAGDNLYEMIVAFHPGNYYMIPYFPAEQPIYRLDYPSMTPLVSDSKLRYLGIVRPEDSPFLSAPGYEAWGAAAFRLYLVYQLKPVILRLVTDGGVDYEKCTLEFLINRCVMEQGTPPEGVSPKPVEYLDSLKF